MKIIFPVNKDNSIKYYDVHYRYLLNILSIVNIPLTLVEIPPTGENTFEIRINDELILIDFSDHLTIEKNLEKYRLCFKYHYTISDHSKYTNIVPFSPVSFHDWNLYNLGRKNIHYTCNNDIILNNQRPGGAAIERRTTVQRMLRDRYGNRIDTRFCKKQDDFFHLINNCLVSVCVPGARNNMLDRGQFQYMALGCCTISPYLDEVLAGGVPLKPQLHYIVCRPDYSDLIERIEWCKLHRDRCISIGRNAANLFAKTSTPNAIWSWILSKISTR